MCGSSTEFTNQATLMPLRTADSVQGSTHRAIAMYYHDGPSGNHNRKVHAACLAFGGGNFAATMRPVGTSQGPEPNFGECMAGGYGTSWGLQEPNGQMVTTLLNTSGYIPGELTDGFGRIAMGQYERFEVVGSNGLDTAPARYIGFNGTLSGVTLFSHANLKYVGFEDGVDVAFVSTTTGDTSLGLSMDPNTFAENVTLNVFNVGPAFITGHGDMAEDNGQHVTTFNLMHYYNDSFS